MVRLSRQPQCPSCGHTQATRRQRKLWMRLIFPASHLLRCRKCRAHYLLLDAAYRSDNIVRQTESS